MCMTIIISVQSHNTANLGAWVWSNIHTHIYMRQKKKKKKRKQITDNRSKKSLSICCNFLDDNASLSQWQDQNRISYDFLFWKWHMLIGIHNDITIISWNMLYWTKCLSLHAMLKCQQILCWWSIETMISFRHYTLVSSSPGSDVNTLLQIVSACTYTCFCMHASRCAPSEIARTGSCDLQLRFAHKRATSLPGNDETEYKPPQEFHVINHDTFSCLHVIDPI